MTVQPPAKDDECTSFCDLPPRRGRGDAHGDQCVSRAMGRELDVKLGSGPAQATVDVCAPDNCSQAFVRVTVPGTRDSQLDVAMNGGTARSFAAALLRAADLAQDL